MNIGRASAVSVSDLFATSSAAASPFIRLAISSFVLSNDSSPTSSIEFAVCMNTWS